jgi:hypothetical protein
MVGSQVGLGQDAIMQWWFTGRTWAGFNNAMVGSQAGLGQDAII